MGSCKLVFGVLENPQKWDGGTLASLVLELCLRSVLMVLREGGSMNLA